MMWLTGRAREALSTGLLYAAGVLESAGSSMLTAERTKSPGGGGRCTSPGWGGGGSRGMAPVGARRAALSWMLVGMDGRLTDARCAAGGWGGSAPGSLADRARRAPTITRDPTDEHAR